MSASCNLYFHIAFTKLFLLIYYCGVLKLIPKICVSILDSPNFSNRQKVSPSFLDGFLSIGQIKKRKLDNFAKLILD